MSSSRDRRAATASRGCSRGTCLRPRPTRACPPALTPLHARRNAGWLRFSAAATPPWRWRLPSSSSSRLCSSSSCTSDDKQLGVTGICLVRPVQRDGAGRSTVHEELGVMYLTIGNPNDVTVACDRFDSLGRRPTRVGSPVHADEIDQTVILDIYPAAVRDDVLHAGNVLEVDIRGVGRCTLRKIRQTREVVSRVQRILPQITQHQIESFRPRRVEHVFAAQIAFVTMPVSYTHLR